MIKVIFILILAFIPALLSLGTIRRSKRQFQTRIRRIRAEPVYSGVMVSDFLDTRENQSIFIGEINCSYNARSPYLRCAINPSGPCEGCLHYRARS